VVCDRFADSTVAYQGYGRGLERSLIERLNETATMGLKPHLTLLLDMPVDVGLARQGKADDAIGREGREFHERVRRGYLEMARLDPDRWRVLDATQPVERVEGQVWHAVEGLLT
jgi:dTMP kinase